MQELAPTAFSATLDCWIRNGARHPPAMTTTESRGDNDERQRRTEGEHKQEGDNKQPEDEEK